jgi:hypothetical protein
VGIIAGRRSTVNRKKGKSRPKTRCGAATPLAHGDDPVIKTIGVAEKMVMEFVRIEADRRARGESPYLVPKK